MHDTDKIMKFLNLNGIFFIKCITDVDKVDRARMVILN